MNPRQLADRRSGETRRDAMLCEKVEIAGAGFLNFRLKLPRLTEASPSAARGEHLVF